MTDLRTAAQQALEALEWHYRQGHSNTLGGLRLKIDEKTLRNLKAALAEPVQEPFGYLWPTGRHPEFRFTQQKRDGVDGMPLYTAPPQRKPLTDEELRLCFTDTNTAEPLSEGWPGLERFARAIELAHGIGEKK